VLSELRKFKKLKLKGAEVFLTGLTYASKRLPDIEFIQLDAVNMKFENELDVVCAFDVLEHIDQDEKAIENVYKALKPGGFFLISVPQHKWLWSIIDDLSNHKRRYLKKELIQKLERANLKILYSTSFVFLLLPLMTLSRFTKRKKLPKNTENECDLFYEMRISRTVNFIFSIAMRIEILLIKAGLRLPAGGSLVAVSYKE
jgi:SAM-dependent methyltransferase